MPILDDIQINIDGWEDRRFSGALPSDEDWNPDQLERWQQRDLLNNKPIVQSEAVKNPYYFSQRSINNLNTVDARLIIVFATAIQYSPYDFIVIEGKRSHNRQLQLVEQGKSRTMNSRHLTGDAIDIAVWDQGRVDWDFEKYRLIAAHVKKVAKQHKIKIEWGGDWIDFKDGVHFQLPWSN